MATLMGFIVENSKGERFQVLADLGVPGPNNYDLYKMVDTGDMVDTAQYDMSFNAHRDNAAEMVFFRMEKHKGTQGDIAELKTLLALLP